MLVAKFCFQVETGHFLVVMKFSLVEIKHSLVVMKLFQVVLKYFQVEMGHFLVGMEFFQVEMKHFLVVILFPLKEMGHSLVAMGYFTERVSRVSNERINCVSLTDGMEVIVFQVCLIHALYNFCQ